MSPIDILKEPDSYTEFDTEQIIFWKIEQDKSSLQESQLFPFYPLVEPNKSESTQQVCSDICCMCDLEILYDKQIFSPVCRTSNRNSNLIHWSMSRVVEFQIKWKLVLSIFDKYLLDYIDCLYLWKTSCSFWPMKVLGEVWQPVLLAVKFLLQIYFYFFQHLLSMYISFFSNKYSLYIPDFFTWNYKDTVIIFEENQNDTETIL